MFFQRVSDWVVRHYDKAFFFAIVIVGGVTIFIVDRLGASKWAAVWICVALMSLYALVALLVPRFKLRPDQSADNLYYQGLLFTLVSLGVALYRFTGEGATSSILRNFGIAIFTTIAGLALRVVVGQFRDDPEDIEAESREAISQTVGRMRSELDLAVAELRSFSDGMRQVVAEFTHTSSKAVTKALETAVQRFEAASEAMVAKLDAGGAGFAERTAAQLAALTAVITALEALAGRVSAVRVDEDMVLARLDPGLRAINTAAAELAQALARHEQQFVGGAQAIETFAASAPRLGEAGDALAAAATRLLATAESLAQASASVERFDAASAAATTATEELAARLRGLDGEFAGSSEAVLRVRRELAELAGWIIERLDRR